jgi:hypothetical protein
MLPKTEPSIIKAQGPLSISKGVPGGEGKICSTKMVNGPLDISKGVSGGYEIDLTIVSKDTISN